MSSRKRVLFYLPTLGQGGIERVVQHIIEQLHDAVEFCVSGQVQKDECILNAQSLEGKAMLLEAPGVNRSSNRYALHHLHGLKRYVDAFRPDIIFSFWHLPNLVTGMLLSMYPASKRPKWVMSVHGESPGFSGNGLFHGKVLSPLLKKVSRLSDCRITVSKRLVPGCEAYYGQPFDLYCNPAVGEQLLELSAIDPGHPWLEPGNKTIVSIGRFDRMKDFPTLVRSFDRVKAEVPDAKLIILGDGPLRDDVRRLVTEKQLDESVDLVGYVSNPYSYLARCRMFAMTSTHGEASPMVLAESMYFSKPIVCTEFFTAPDFIDHGVNGLLAACGDTEDVAGKIVSVLTDEESAARMTRSAKEMVVERHGVVNATQRYLDLISGL